MKFQLPRRIATVFLAIVAVCSLGLAAEAGELKLKSQLIWGTDGPKPEGKDLEELAGKNKEKLKPLRWKHYWIIKSEVTKVTEKEQEAQLGKCAVSLRDVGNGHVEIKLFDVTNGKHKHLRTVTEPIQRLTKGHAVVIGGDSKDTWDDAWMVMLTVAP